ncbi:methyltransferase domain-containing protein [Hoyosella rhizosphaerae]|uniref:Methyltransferase n=1 Tax=Hoyosella rhizosphaerae TaxID=1755582 RepID=A0A916U7X3_9ACTN|nr:methyltransferase domain-containing protein [Hoyosella rhizosphaerae]MBN4927653.1 methyltransferase domain-containing protein [Hoyosella rhizosphaerae]GGC62758.1 methyltransferase [Hoyosella rhizosphaerae]
MPAKYTASAQFYDAISFEWPVYGAGREAALKLMRLRAGAKVLDMGCGTGLNFGHIQHRIGPDGWLVGVDLSSDMITQASRKAHVNEWSNVSLATADATRTTAEALCEALGGEKFDAAIATYSLSLMADWRAAFDTMVAACKPGARVAVVDMQVPTGRSAVWAPLARAACRAGGADIHAHPWTRLEQRCTNVDSVSLRGGHIQVRVGTVPRD